MTNEKNEMNVEREARTRIFSDRALKQVAEYNIFDKPEAFKELVRILCSGSMDDSFELPYHPALGRLGEDDYHGIETSEVRKRIGNNPGAIFCDAEEHLGAVKKYLTNKELGCLTERDIELSSCSHGGWLSLLLSRGKIFNPIRETFKAIPKDFMDRSRWGRNLIENYGYILESPKRIMASIDIEHVEDPEFDNAYTGILGDYLQIAPRVFTLMARDANWDVNDLEVALKEKHDMGKLHSHEFYSLRRALNPSPSCRDRY